MALQQGSQAGSQVTEQQSSLEACNTQVLVQAERRCSAQAEQRSGPAGGSWQHRQALHPVANKPWSNGRQQQQQQWQPQKSAPAVGGKRKSSGGSGGGGKSATKPLAPPAQRIDRFFAKLPTAAQTG